MKRLSTQFVNFATCFLLFAAVAATRADDKKADPAGTYTWSVPGRNGGPDREMTLKLKVEDGKLMGTVSGGQNETKIEHGKISGDEVSFDVTRERNGNSFTTKYKGKVTADAITGKIEMPGRDGQSRDRDWTAKRKKS
jgi:hypothetical protein